MVKKVFILLKKESLILESFLPWAFTLLAIVFAFSLPDTISYLWINLLGLTQITRGTILALRPGIRCLINPKESIKKIVRRNRNVTILAFIWIMAGFSLLISGLLFEFVKNIISMGWFLIILGVITYFLVMLELNNILSNWRKKK